MTKSNTQTTTETEAQVATFDFAAKFKELGDKKSPMIRYMATLPMYTKTDGKPNVGAINKAFEAAGVKMIYQHVRNVLNQKPKKAA